MRIRTAVSAAAVATAALLALTACSKDDKTSSQPPTVPAITAPATTGGGSSGGSGGLNPATSALLIASLQKIDPSLGSDPAKTATDAQEQCAALAGGDDQSGHDAAQRFSTPDHALTDTEGQEINAALNALVCAPPNASKNG